MKDAKQGTEKRVSFLDLDEKYILEPKQIREDYLKMLEEEFIAEFDSIETPESFDKFIKTYILWSLLKEYAEISYLSSKNTIKSKTILLDLILEELKIILNPKKIAHCKEKLYKIHKIPLSEEELESFREFEDKVLNSMFYKGLVMQREHLLKNSQNQDAGGSAITPIESEKLSSPENKDR